MTNNKKIEIEIENGAKDLENLKNLDLDEIEELIIHNYKSISLRFLKDFHNLKSLMIFGSVKDYSHISSCLSLEFLYLSTSGAIDNLDFIKKLPLKGLQLECFRTKNDSFTIPNLKTIETISISSVSAIVDLSFLSEFTQIKYIELFDLKSKQLFNFSKLKSLHTLKLVNMYHLKQFSELKTIRTLDTLYLQQFYINRKVKLDIKTEFSQIVHYLTNVKTINLDINGEKFDKNQLMKL